MATSHAMATQVQCPSCGREFVADVWIVVDVGERPDLAERLRGDTLHVVQCPGCGQKIGTREPLLLYAPDGDPAFMIGEPLGKASTPQDRAERFAALRTGLGPAWRDDFLDNVIVCPYHALAVTLSRGPEVAAALDRAVRALVSAKDAASARAVVEAHPVLLSEDAELFLRALSVRQSRAQARRLGLERSGWIRQCRTSGVSRAFDIIEDPAGFADGLVTAGAPDDPVRFITEGADVLTLLPQEGEEARRARLNLRLAIAVFGQHRADPVERRGAVEACLALDLPDGSSAEEIAAWAERVSGLGTAFVDWVDGDREQAIELGIYLYESLLRRLDPERHTEPLAETWGNLGIAYYKRLLGDSSENIGSAIHAFERALELATVETLPDTWVRTQVNLASALTEWRGGDRAQRIERALEALDAARQVRTKEDDPAGWAAIMVNLGATYLQRTLGHPIQNSERAIISLENALDALDRHADRAIWAHAQCNLAAAYSERRVGRKEENLEASLEASRAALEVLTPQADGGVWAGTLANHALGLVRRFGGESRQALERAIEECDAALGVATRDRFPTEWAAARAVRALARTELALIDPQLDVAEALAEYDEVVRYYEDARLAAPCRRVATELGGHWFRLGRWSEAVRAFDVALEQGERLYAASMLRTGRESELAASAHTRARLAFARAKQGDLPGAVMALELGRGRRLREALGSEQADLERLRSLDPALVEQYRAAVRELERLEATEDSISIDPARVQGLAHGLPLEQRGRVEAARRSFEGIVERIRRKPGLSSFLGEPGFADVVGVARENVPLVYLATTSVGSLGLVVFADGRVDPVWADLTATDLAGLLVTWQEGGASFQGVLTLVDDPDDPNRATITVEGDEPVGGFLPAQDSSEKRFGKELDRVLDALGDGLMRPVAERLGAAEAREARLIPCGLLALLPLHAATYSVGGARTSVLDELSVGYGPSAGALAFTSPFVRPEGPRLLAVGNPLPHSMPLVYAALEVGQIAACFPTSARRLLIGAEGSKASFLGRLQGSTHVHLACHGYFDDTAPLASSLDFAGEEGLTLSEMISVRDLNHTALVVLSACQSAVTDFRHLPDEAVGFPAGLMQAGPGAIVGTLWPVGDLSTALLMTKFYRLHMVGEDGYEPLDPLPSLVRAQLWLRDVTAEELRDYVDTLFPLKGSTELDDLRRKLATVAPGYRPYASARHWAGFTYSGR